MALRRIDYVLDVQPLEASAMTDAEIAQRLAESGITVKAFDVYALRRFLDDEGLLSQDADGRWVGPVADRARDPQTGAAQSDAMLQRGLNSLFAHLRDARSRTIDTTQPARAAQVFAVVGALVSLRVATSDERQAMYAIADGERFAGVTEEDVSAARDAYMAEEARAALHAEFTAAINEHVHPLEHSNDRQAMVAGLRAAADRLDSP